MAMFFNRQWICLDVYQWCSTGRLSYMFVLFFNFIVEMRTKKKITQLSWSINITAIYTLVMWKSFKVMEHCSREEGKKPKFLTQLKWNSARPFIFLQSLFRSVVEHCSVHSEGNCFTFKRSNYDPRGTDEFNDVFCVFPLVTAVNSLNNKRR